MAPTWIPSSLRPLQVRGFPAELVNLSQRFDIPSADLHASYQYVEKARDIVRSLKPGICLVLGSGSMTDIVKQTLFLEGSDAVFISVPTALTVTAFTSSFSVIDRHGAKRTQPSREINATFWIRSVLDSAPMRMSGQDTAICSRASSPMETGIWGNVSA